MASSIGVEAEIPWQSPRRRFARPSWIDTSTQLLHFAGFRASMAN